MKTYMKMKGTSIVIIFILLTGCLSAVPCPQEEEKIREEVSVTHVEVPVRVFYMGKAVDHLTGKDFKLFEDKKLQTITGCFPTRKKIEVQNTGLTEENRESEFLPPRFFVLVFRLSDYTSDIKQGVDYLFKHIVKDNDQLLVFVNDRTLFFNQSSREENRKDLLDQALKKESVKANQRLISYFRKIQRELYIAKSEITMKEESEQNVHIDTRPAQLVSFLKNYLSTWQEYKKRYLLPDIDKYYNLADYLAKIHMEKWIINFYQTEMFPKIKYTGELRRQIDRTINELLASNSEEIVYSRMLLSLLKDIDMELNAAADFDADEISKLFYKVNATCHSVFCRSRKEAASQDLEFREISTDIENSLREITAKTGGSLIASNDLKSALHSISERDDIYYMLTYAPENPEKIGKIKVVVNNKKYKVIYDNNMRADYIKEYLAKKSAGLPEIHIDSISFHEKKLSIAIGQFLRQETGSGERGKISVRVRIKDEEDKIVFNKSKCLIPDQDITTISINFDWLKKGKYNVLVNVTDILTGKTTENFLQPQVHF